MKTYRDELMHYGVKGQKWGVRRTPEQLGHDVSKRIKKTKKRFEKEHQEHVRVKKAKASEMHAYRNRRVMSDEELNRRISRLQKEKQYRELIDSEVAPGRKYVNDILKDSGRTAVKSVVTAAAMTGTMFVVSKHFGTSPDPNVAQYANIFLKYISPKKK